MKKSILITGLVVVAVIAVILALKPFSSKEETVTFETVKVEKGSIANSVTATGTIEAITTVDVGTQVSGIIQHVYVDFNDVVRQGQILARLDETPLKTQLEQSQASVNQAQAQLNYQEATYKRLKALYEKNLIAQSDYDQALFNYENSKASLSNARSALARAQVNLDYATITSPIDGVVLNRAVEEGQTVAASFNTPTLFTIVNDLTQMEVETSVDEADIGKVKEGQRVEFTVDAYPDLSFAGSVVQVRLQPVTTNNVVTYSVILRAPNPDKKLMPGMTASTTIYVDEKSNTLKVSGKAARFTPDGEWLQKMAKRLQNGKNQGLPGDFAGAPPSGMQGEMPSGAPAPGGEVSQAASGNFALPTLPQGMKTLWVKDQNGMIKPVMVKTGIDNGIEVEILSGLAEGDEVVYSMSTTAKAQAAAKTNNGPQGPFPF
ncbi:MAG: efflux RND transporter periplasmic adaptor subunit [Bacteroidales bacterium]